MSLSPLEIIGILLSIGFIFLALFTDIDIFLWFGAVSLVVGILGGEVLEK